MLRIVRRFPFQIRSLISVSSLAVLGAVQFASVPNGNAQERQPAKSAYRLKDLDGHFPFLVPQSKEAWEKRAEELRMQIKVSLGIFPKPTLATLKPVVYGKREFDGYAVEKVYFESLPGFFVTGSLFTPTDKKSERMPAVLCPHGHWNNGRFYQADSNAATRELAVGAERFESGAKAPLQARCVQLARMGCVVFHYDMLGNADSQQINLDRAHRFGLAGPNPKVADGRWLLYSPQAEGHLQSIMGLQTINSMQAFEFLYNRSDVDPNRISITGASGGGTQTFILTAIEPRLAGAYPVVMVSTSMQGGCTCENASGLRVDTGNVEIAALCAPRPLAVNSADDWTKNMAKDGYPELQQLYALYGAKDRVSFYPGTHFPHNYNHVTRVNMYGFMSRLFGLGQKEPILEREFHPLSPDELTVWDSEHPKPIGGIEFESELLKRWEADATSQIAKSPEIAKLGWKALLAPAERIAATLKAKIESDGSGKVTVQNDINQVVGTLKISGSKDRAVTLRLLSGNAIEGVDLNSKPVGANDFVVSDAWQIDLGKEQSLVPNPRPAACYTYGYNPPLSLRKLAVVLAYLDSNGQKSKVNLQAEGGDAFLAAAARFLRPNLVANVEIDAKGFDFAKIDSIRDVNFLPGALRFGGLDGLKP